MISKLANIEALQPIFSMCACCITARGEVEKLRQTSESAVEASAVAFASRAVGENVSDEEVKTRGRVAQDTLLTAQFGLSQVEGAKTGYDDLLASVEELHADAVTPWQRGAARTEAEAGIESNDGVVRGGKTEVGASRAGRSKAEGPAASGEAIVMAGKQEETIFMV